MDFNFKYYGQIDISNINNLILNTKLNIIGLMCIPPVDNLPNFYFKKMNELAKKYSYKQLSMGMSNDYITAIENGATFIRIGSGIFGVRSN